MRLVGLNAQAEVVPILEALRRAQESGYDLVEINAASRPPICKIMDYGKYKYEMKKRQHEHHKHQPEIKELRLRPKTEQHDLLVRVKQARQFIERGDRVLVNVFFRGREMAHADLGRAVLDRFVQEMQDIAKLERPPMMEGRRLGIVLVKR